MFNPKKTILAVVIFTASPIIAMQPNKHPEKEDSLSFDIIMREEIRRATLPIGIVPPTAEQIGNQARMFIFGSNAGDPGRHLQALAFQWLRDWYNNRNR
jgi:hypothetical protein